MRLTFGEQKSVNSCTHDIKRMKETAETKETAVLRRWQSQKRKFAMRRVDDGIIEDILRS